MMDYFAYLVRVNLIVKQLHTDREWGQWFDDGMCQNLNHVSKHQQFLALLTEDDVINKFSILRGNFWKACIGTP